MEALKEEIIILNAQNPKLLEKVLMLEEELDNAKKNLKLKNIFKAYELDKNGMVGTKQIIEKFTGNKKFEVDEKLGLPEFTKLIENIADSNVETEKILLDKFEKAVQGNYVFKDELENPLYKRTVQLIKEMKKPKAKK